jgi:hypothetical protein
MKKLLFSAGLLAITTVSYAQPHCFVFGPAMNVGSTNVTNYSFTRNYSTDASGVPTATFSNFGDAKVKNTSAGMMMDIYTRRSRIAFDLMFPFKETSGNVFNFNLAFGGYVKEKVGILVGLSYYANKKKISYIPADSSNSVYWSETGDATSTGNLYNDANIVSQGGVNLLLTYALAENFVFRLDYGFYAGGITNDKTGEPENYEWDLTHSRKLEFSASWMISDIFGLAFKVNSWKTSGIYSAEMTYTQNGNEQTAEVDLMPERTFRSNNFTFCLMIPLGGAEAGGGTYINVAD